jgi:hypothetical protein
MLLVVNRFLLYVDTSPNLDGRRRLAAKCIHYTHHDEKGWSALMVIHSLAEFSCFKSRKRFVKLFKQRMPRFPPPSLSFCLLSYVLSAAVHSVSLCVFLTTSGTEYRCEDN